MGLGTVDAPGDTIVNLHAIVSPTQVPEVTTMPRTLQDIIDHADGLATQFKQMESGNLHHAVVANLREAVLDNAHAEQNLAGTVTAARQDGLSWAAIGIVLGTSGQAARKRYGHAIEQAIAERT